MAVDGDLEAARVELERRLAALEARALEMLRRVVEGAAS